jgi:Domain of unknown function (DUF5658)
MRITRTLLGGCVLFALLGLADLALTAYLLRECPGQFYESNPLARWWLDGWGWVGLIAFKASLVLAVLVTVRLVALQRPRTATRVLGFSCGVTGLVLGYSGLLAVASWAEVGVFRVRDDATIAAESRRLEDRLRQARQYREVLDRVSAELAGGRCTLTQAVGELAATDKGRDPEWLRQLRGLYPNRSDSDCLAAALLSYTYRADDGASELEPARPRPQLQGRATKPRNSGVLSLLLCERPGRKA